MTRFSADTASEATVTAERKAVWDVLVDPALLPKLTPLLSKIEADSRGAKAKRASDGLWRWHMVRLAVLGVGIKPVFTERMAFDDGTRSAGSTSPTSRRPASPSGPAPRATTR